ncbi:MAG: hypothetical protein QOJ81_208 [Chloroflexota bacterium]|jgi:uncharacterized protein (DUF1697 family)|nr:hypothetical protein [Chloroflexota bacterium]
MPEMNTYVVLLRGVNVGGKNVISMAALRTALEALGFENVASYIASGNLILDSTKSAAATQAAVEGLLADKFKVSRESARALVLTQRDLEAVVKKRPKGFGDEPGKYHSDAVFLIDVKAAAAMKVFSPREGVDTIWPGSRVVYSQRISAQRTKSRLNRIVGTPEYKQMTIRSWNTTVKLLELLKSRSAAARKR